MEPRDKKKDLAWQLVRKEPVADCAVFHVSRTHARSPRTGAVHPFYRIDADPWCNIVALTSSDEIVMVEQYRHGSEKVTLEIPGGIVDPGENPGDAAARELREETGYRVEAVIPLGIVNPNPALFGNHCHSFLARDAQLSGEIEVSALEETQVVLVPRDDLSKHLRSGRIDHALVVAALHWFALAES